MASTSALARFEQTLRGRPIATDDFAGGAYAQPKARAVTLAEIAPDPDGWIRALRVDVDHADAATRWMDAELPQPTFTIVNPKSGRAHLVWELASWVRTVRPKQLRLFEAVRRAFTVALDGDRAYSGTFQHNPLASHWRTIEGPDNYRLTELAGHVDLFAAPPAAATSAKLADLAQHGRNCAAFASAAKRAYAFVETFRRVGDRNGFEARVAEVVVAENAVFTMPLPANEIRSITRSIAGWTWNVYRRGAKAATAQKSTSERSRAEYLAGALTAREEARNLRAAGISASEIARRMNRSRSWVYIALAEPSKTDVQSATPIRVCVPERGVDAGAELLEYASQTLGFTAGRGSSHPSCEDPRALIFVEHDQTIADGLIATSGISPGTENPPKFIDGSPLLATPGCHPIKLYYRRE